MEKPGLRLFMSVDVVGSTAYKQRSTKTDPQAWLALFASFYTEFPQLVNLEIEKIKESKNLQSLHPPILWKSLGDELVFSVRLEHRSEACSYLIAFRNAVNAAIEKLVHGTDPSPPISFKASAWLAGFPVGNARIPLEIQDNRKDEDAFDYIGPLIDIGFRLGKFASPRHFVLSVDLTYLVLKAGSCDFQFYIMGMEPLKGVLNNREYPIIWIDGFQGIDEARKRPDHHLIKAHDSLFKPNRLDHDELREYCQRYIETIGEPLMIPFIVGKGDDTTQTPEDYPDRLKKVVHRLRDQYTCLSDGEEMKPEMASKIPELEEFAGEDPTAPVTE